MNLNSFLRLMWAGSLHLFGMISGGRLDLSYMGHKLQTPVLDCELKASS